MSESNKTYRFADLLLSLIVDPPFNGQNTAVKHLVKKKNKTLSKPLSTYVVLKDSAKELSSQSGS